MKNKEKEGKETYPLEKSKLNRQTVKKLNELLQADSKKYWYQSLRPEWKN